VAESSDDGIELLTSATAIPMGRSTEAHAAISTTRHCQLELVFLRDWWRKSCHEFRLPEDAFNIAAQARIAELSAP
jgi:hypothetical protein